MLVASPHSSRWTYVSDAPASASKRKRNSCGFEGGISVVPDARSFSPLPDAEARGKRSRVVADEPAAIHSRLPSSPANVPFSAAFRSNQPQRPPTLDEQRAWASANANASANADSAASAAVRASTPTRPSVVTASSQWVQVQTDYGHGFVPREEAHNTVPTADVECSINEAGMALDDCPAQPSSQRVDGAHAARFEPPNSLWNHVEGDTEMASSMDTRMPSVSDSHSDSHSQPMYDPDTARRGDCIDWEEDVLQLKVPDSLPHAHPYRSQLGASYFDRAVFPATSSSSS